ncbi:MAG: hypothetical protein IPI67_13200 [Myxococcales bacterium]|nr:hypothetical protein [Myxococcales bacterium]
MQRLSLTVLLPCAMTLSCGGTTEKDASYASFAEVSQAGKFEEFHFRGGEVKCWHEELYPSVLIAEFSRQGQTDLQLRIRMAPDGNDGAFSAAGESTAVEPGSPLACSIPCARFNWQHGERAATSMSSLDSCRVDADFRAGTIEAPFHCLDMLANTADHRTSLVQGKFLCGN